jgi:pimeloyl-ACP methyl ester carboxylesterase
MEFFMKELDVVRKAALGKEQKVHLVGHGWGGILALNYMLEGTSFVATHRI